MSDKNKEPTLPVEFKEYFDLQKEEVQLRNEELKLKAQQQKNDHEIAIQSLLIQKEIYNKSHGERRKDRMYYFVFIMIGLISITSLCVYLIENGQVDIAKYIITALVSALAGGGSGYSVGLYKGSHGIINDDDNNT